MSISQLFIMVAIALLIGQRSNFARRIKLQFLGLIWTATGADTNTLADDHPHFRGMFIAPEGATIVRYNAVYPRWVYDQYRESMADHAESAG